MIEHSFQQALSKLKEVSMTRMQVQFLKLLHIHITHAQIRTPKNIHFCKLVVYHSHHSWAGDSLLLERSFDAPR